MLHWKTNMLVCVQTKLRRLLEQIGSAPLVIVRKRSCPAVSHICSLIHLLSSIIFLILKSILHSICGSCRVIIWSTAAVVPQITDRVKLRSQDSPDCGDEARSERVFWEPQQQTTLAHTCCSHSPFHSVTHAAPYACMIQTWSAGSILLTNECWLTTVANKQKLDKIVIVLPSSGGPHLSKGPTQLVVTTMNLCFVWPF